MNNNGDINKKGNFLEDIIEKFFQTIDNTRLAACFFLTGKVTETAGKLIGNEVHGTTVYFGKIGEKVANIAGNAAGLLVQDLMIVALFFPVVYLGNKYNSEIISKIMNTRPFKLGNALGFYTFGAIGYIHAAEYLLNIRP